MLLLHSDSGGIYWLGVKGGKESVQSSRERGVEHKSEMIRNGFVETVKALT